MNCSRRGFLVRSGLVSLGGTGILISACGGGGGKSSQYGYFGYQYVGNLITVDGPRWINYGPNNTLIVGEQWKRRIHIVNQNGVTERTYAVPGGQFQNQALCLSVIPLRIKFGDFPTTAQSWHLYWLATDTPLVSKFQRQASFT